MPFSKGDLDRYLVEHKITGAVSDYIYAAEARLARDIGTSGYTCVVAEYQSRKMGTTVNTESRTAECIFTIHLDFDPKVIAFYEQPPSVDCYRQTKRCIKRLTDYVPDMLVLGDRGPYVVQVKPQEKLEALISRPSDWFKSEDGAFHDRAADEAFARLPLPHQVISTSQLSPQFTSNLLLLMQSLDYGSDDRACTESIIRDLRSRQVASLQEIASAHEISDLTPILRLIARHQIFTDLFNFSLAEPDNCVVASTPSLLRADVYETWKPLLRDPDGTLDGEASQEILPLSKHLNRGIEIVDLLASGAIARTARRWRAKIRDGAARGMSNIAAVTPRYDLSGNRTRKRPEIVLAFAENIIRTHWASGAKPSPKATFRIYKTEAEEWHPDYQPLSPPTFRRMRQELEQGLALNRGGRRLANAVRPPTDVGDRALRPNRPFQLASCDHYLCDIFSIVLHANGTSYAMQPWLTVMRDCYTKQVLAFWLTLRSPSRRSCALLMRQCLRAHGRLPEWIIVDRGADFRSVYFSELMAHCRIHLMFRPSGDPRYGSEAERFFGQFKSFWLAMRPGNRVCIREVRSVSGSHRPQNLACLSLLDLWDDLIQFNAWFDHYAPDSSLASPAVLAADGLRRFSCSGRCIPYDDQFVIASAVDDGTYALDHQRGLHIDAFHFWHPSLAGVRASSMSVRRDPQDPYRVYALNDRRWITCLASPAPAFAKKSPLRQAAEGVIMLDGSKLREIVRSDADRALVHALRDRQNAPSTPLSIESLNSPQPLLPHHDQASKADFFAEVSDRNLAPLETAKWS